MAAEALKKAGEKLGVEVKVETQGGIGIENVKMCIRDRYEVL